MTRRSGAPAGHGTHREAIDALRLSLLAQQQLSTTTEKKKMFFLRFWLIWPRWRPGGVRAALARREVADCAVGSG